MYMQSRKLIRALSLALAIAAISSPALAEKTSQDVINARQATQIWTTYALNPYLRANDLKVSVQNGKATLTGRVDEGVNKDLAKQIALGVNGIREVDNQIVVQADYVAPTHASTRAYGEVVDDATITAVVKSKLMWSKYTDGLTTDVDTKSGRVTLLGTADTGAAKDFAGRLAMNTRGVMSVDNQLMVGNKPTMTDSMKRSSHEAERGISDSWITAKVKSTLLYSSNVSGSAITVSTRGGIVTLSGKVNSGAERALAIELALNVRGVRSVQAKGLVN